MLREPLKRALEALVMERQTEGKATFPPFMQKLIDRGVQDGERKGELRGRRETLLRLVARVGIALTEEDRARVRGCEDAATLDRWLDNVLGAKSAADVFS